MTADQLAQAIRDANGSGRVPTLEAATAALYKAHADKTTTDIEGIVAAAAESYADQSPPARATMLAILPSAASVPAMERFDAAARRALVDAATTGEPADRLSITLTLLTRITDPADPIFDAVIGSSDPTTGEIAQLIRSRLEQGTPTIAVTGPGIKPLAGLKSRQTSALRK
jgi:hypothetical protein